MEEKKEDGMGTLRKDRTLLRDDKKMEKLKAKLHTDDEREFNLWSLHSFQRLFLLHPGVTRGSWSQSQRS